MLVVVDDPVMLEELNDFHQYFAVLQKEFFIMHVFERKIIIGIEFQNSEALSEILCKRLFLFCGGTIRHC